MALTVLDAGVVIAEARDRGDDLAIPVAAYAEALVGAYRAGTDAAATVDAFLAALPARVEPATHGIARAAAQLRAVNGSKLRLPDALVIATALERQAALLLTTDAGWPQVPVTVEVVAGKPSSG